MTNAWASNPRTTSARMNATTMASTVSRCPSRAGAGVSTGAAFGAPEAFCKVAEDRPIVLLFLSAGRPGCQPVSVG